MVDGQSSFGVATESGSETGWFPDLALRVDTLARDGIARAAPLSASIRATMQMMLDGLDEQAALVARDGSILAANRAWKRVAEEPDFASFRVGDNYLLFALERAARGDQDGIIISRGLIEMCRGSRTRFRHAYRAMGTLAGREFLLHVARVEFGDDHYLVVTRQDITELNDLKRERRSLGTRLLRVQAQERRRIARDLHDSTGQLLVALQLNIMQLKRAELGVGSSSALAECGEVLDRVQREIRTLSFLSHPPALHNHGLASAVESLVRGFGARTELAVEVLIGELGVTSPAIEAVVYRLLQEALANIHRHAKASQVKVYLCATSDALHLSIRDDGVGFDYRRGFRSVQPGVGVVGMRERVEELDGQLTIQKVGAGTLLTASIPRNSLIS